MSARPALRTTSFVAVGAISLNACTSVGDTASNMALAANSATSAATLLPPASNHDSVETKTKFLGRGCVVTFSKGRAVVSSVGTVRYEAAHCRKRPGSTVARKSATREVKPAANSIDEDLSVEFTAHFDLDSARLDNFNQAKLDEAIGTLGQVTAKTIQIRGFADPTGTSDYNRALCEARAQIVAEYLASRGIDSERWYVLAGGEDRSATDPANARRAELKMEL